MRPVFKILLGIAIIVAVILFAFYLYAFSGMMIFFYNFLTAVD